MRKESGFTLLETMLAMSILAVIMSVIFSITTSSIGLSESIVTSQAHARQKAEFTRYFRQLFSEIPSEAQFTLEPAADGKQTLNIRNTQSYFPAQGRQQLGKEIWLRTEINRNSLASLNLQISNQIEEESYNEDAITFHCALVENLTQIRWEFYHQSRNEWSPEWTPAMGRPSQIKLFLTYPESPDEHMLYFWIPSRKPPAQRINARQP